MAILYSKGGDKVVIPHAIDVKDWLDDGYTLEDTSKTIDVEVVSVNEPEKENEETIETELSEEEQTESEWFDEVKDKLGSLSTDDVKRAAEIVGIEYTSKRETIASIKDSLK